MNALQTLAVLVVGLAAAQPAISQAIGDSRASTITETRARVLPSLTGEAQSDWPNFGNHAASHDVRRMAKWIGVSGNNGGLPYMIVDKIEAKVFLFDARYALLGTAPALLGLGQGDDSAVGIGQRRLATMEPSERTTPAGRFEASLGFDLEQDVLWIDYDAALSMHRVIIGNVRDRRHERLGTATPLDNRISYGCINVPTSFYDMFIKPAFKGTVGIVYILPETKPLSEVFAIGGRDFAGHDTSSRTDK